MSVHITNNFLCPAHSSPLSLPSLTGLVAMESSSVASASSEAGSTRSQDIEELERFIDSYVLEYQVQGLLSDKNETDQDVDKTPSHTSQVKHAASFTSQIIYTLPHTSQVKHTPPFTSQIIYTLSHTPSYTKRTLSHTSQVKHTPSYTKRTLSHTSQVKHTPSYTKRTLSHTSQVKHIRPTPNTPCPTPHR